MNAPLASTPLRLSLTALAPTGEAIGRADGLVVFVPGGLPGETVEVDVVFRRRSFARGRLRRVITPAAGRIAPVCPHFGRCGGCDLQHMDGDAQLRFKTDAVREQLSRLGGIANADVRACLPSPRPWRYRNHTQFAALAGGRLGYHAEGSADIVPIDDCPITAEEVLAVARHAAAPPLPESIDARAGLTGAGRARAFRAADGAPGAPEGDATLHERIAGFDFAFSPRNFFQVNPFAAETLVAEVLAAAAPRAGQRALDVYCGVGLFTLPLAAATGFAAGIEADGTAVQFARRNAAAAGLSEVTRFHAGPADALMGGPATTGANWDLVVVDPPRAGLDRGALQALLGLATGRIIYVSCDPATLARDAKAMVAEGYALRYAQPVDLFPQTRHVETVACFDLINASAR